MSSNSIPFLENPDNTHCFQCVLGMIQRRDFPQQAKTIEELVEFTGKRPGMWTWSTRGMVEMKRLGYDVVNWREFDYEDFAIWGGEYLLERYGLEMGQAQIEHCDLSYEMSSASELGSLLKTRQGVPTWEDIAALIDDQYLVVCNVNSKALNGVPGYSGHFVLLYDIDIEKVEMHDPGPPAIRSRVVSRADFLRAWEYPSDKERNLMAFKFVGMDYQK